MFVVPIYITHNHQIRVSVGTPCIVPALLPAQCNSAGIAFLSSHLTKEINNN